MEIKMKHLTAIGNLEHGFDVYSNHTNDMNINNTSICRFHFDVGFKGSISVSFTEKMLFGPEGLSVVTALMNEILLYKEFGVLSSDSYSLAS